MKVGKVLLVDMASVGRAILASRQEGETWRALDRTMLLVECEGWQPWYELVDRSVDTKGVPTNFMVALWPSTFSISSRLYSFDTDDRTLEAEIRLGRWAVSDRKRTEVRLSLLSVDNFAVLGLVVDGMCLEAHVDGSAFEAAVRYAGVGDVQTQP